jgi:hypothetical protein
MRGKKHGLGWTRLLGWLTRLILILFIALEVEIWLDVFLIQPEEYERLIGSESACGMFESYCSWTAYLLDNVPFIVLAALATIGLLWRGLPRRELVLGIIAIAICGYLGWRVYDVQLNAAMIDYCCEGGKQVSMMAHLEPLPDCTPSLGSPSSGSRT